MKVTAADLFAAGTKIVGVLTLIKAIEVLIMTVPGLFGPNLPDWAISQQIAALVYPLALLTIGIYLIQGTASLVKKCFPDSAVMAMESARTIFQLAMKITGMVLLVYAVPELLRILSNALYVGYYHRFGIETFDQQLLIAERILAALVSAGFGFYLLQGGNCFLRLAFRDEKDSGQEKA